MFYYVIQQGLSGSYYYVGKDYQMTRNHERALLAWCQTREDAMRIFIGTNGYILNETEVTHVMFLEKNTVYVPEWGSEFHIGKVL